VSERVRKLIEALARFPGNAELTNHYSSNDPRLDLPDGAAIRRKNLRNYLQYFLNNPPRLIILGEAPGYRGCRFSGMVFTSEFTLLNHSFFSGGAFARSSCKPKPWKEASASIVWETLDKLGEPALLWATLPFHPHRLGEPLSNRTPTRAEQLAGFEFFIQLRKIFPEPKIVAAGRIASNSLTGANIPHFPVRHPSHGGKMEFQSGVLAAVKEIGKGARGKG
jgi:uracil-DNA glycosylase